MKKILFLLLSILAFSLLSCGSKENRIKSEIEVAHAHNCMSFDEFCDLKYSYVFEKKLPCLVYLSSFYVSDIVSVVDTIIHDDEDGDVVICWTGNPSNRECECWMKGSITANQYISLDKEQAEWVISQTKYTKTINTPMIIKVYQVGCKPELFSGHFMSYKADLVSIENR